MIASELGCVPLPGNARIDVAIDVHDGAIRVALRTPDDKTWLMGTDSAAALAALLIVADTKARELWEFHHHQGVDSALVRAVAR